MFALGGRFRHTRRVPRSDPVPRRLLTTVLFTDIVGSTQRAQALGDRRWRQLLTAHHRIMRKDLKRFRGREVDTAGDGFFATFEQPSDAIDCATAMIDDLGSIDVEIRAGIHMGEVELAGKDVRGIAVHVGARVMSKAGAGEVLVSSTVRDLMAGSDVRFDDAGTHELKGINAPMHLYSAEHEVAPSEAAPVDRALADEAAPRRSRLPWTVAGIGVLVLVVGGVVYAGRRGSGAEPAADSVVALDASGAVTDEVAVGARPSALATDGTDLWVANFDDGTVQRIDTTTDAATAARGVDSPTGIAVGEGTAWVSGFSGQLTPIDASQGTTQPPITLTPGIAGVAYGSGAVWVASANDGTVIRLDPVTQARRIVRLPAGAEPRDVAVGDTAVWVADASGHVYEIAPTTLKVARAIALLDDRPADRIAVGAGYVWVTNTTTDSVIRIDPANGTTTTIERVADGPLGIAAGDGVVWVAGSLDGTLARIDASSGTVDGDPIHLGFSPTAVAIVGDRAWVSLSATP
jgi:class 3 adenylate cyclase/streptogramin lyase